MMLSGSALFLAALGVMPLIPGYFAACAVLVLGGLGLALFGNMQTTLILTGSPPALRSRIMGLITVCIGAGPVGQLLIGTLGDRIGPLAAVMAVALAGLTGLGVVAVLWRAAPAPALLSVGPLSAVPDPAARRPEKAASTAGNTLPPPAVRRSSAGT
jgi:MFS family permease